MNEFICCRNHKVDDKKLLGFEFVQLLQIKLKLSRKE